MPKDKEKPSNLDIYAQLTAYKDADDVDTKFIAEQLGVKQQQIAGQFGA